MNGNEQLNLKDQFGDEVDVCDDFVEQIAEAFTEDNFPTGYYEGYKAAHQNLLASLYEHNKKSLKAVDVIMHYHEATGDVL